MSAQERIASSFRDPSGVVFSSEGQIYRQVNQLYRTHYDHLIASGLYQRLVDADLLISHADADLSLARSDRAYRVIRPEQLAFIAYPYEWTFGQLKDAALATLKIQKIAFEFGMTLKDASAYNIQFVRGKPLLIDTLSFEIYQEGQVWIAYRQFCQHFLAPLALMGYRDVRLSQLLRVYIDGLPLDLAARLLPLRSRLKLGLLIHLHLHARSQRRYAGEIIDVETKQRKMKRNSFLGLIDNLEGAVKGLRWRNKGTAWADYYEGHSYDDDAFAHKKQLVAEFLDEAAPKSVWDLGANTGYFSRLASERGIPTIAWDFDAGAVEANYQQVARAGETNLLPLVLDLTNPSPAIGWANTERLALGQRGGTDAIIALALIHHLAIANNVPLGAVAAFFAGLGAWLIIEFVPKSDAQVKKLLATRADIFPNYTPEGFEAAFGERFTVVRREIIHASGRVLYLLRTKRDG